MESQIVIQYNREDTRLVLIKPEINEDGIFNFESTKPKIYNVSELSVAEKQVYDAFVAMVESKQ